MMGRRHAKTAWSAPTVTETGVLCSLLPRLRRGAPLSRLSILRTTGIARTGALAQPQCGPGLSDPRVQAFTESERPKTTEPNNSDSDWGTGSPRTCQPASQRTNLWPSAPPSSVPRYSRIPLPSLRCRRRTRRSWTYLGACVPGSGRGTSVAQAPAPRGD